MASGTQEKDFEKHIEDYLTGHGYHKLEPQNYDRALGLVKEEVLTFIQETQPKAYAALQAQHGASTDERLLRNLAKNVERDGLLPVLRKGIKDSGQTLKLVYFRPASGLNAEHEELYRKNRFGVMRQVRYATTKKDEDKSVDMVLTLNGLPVLTAELKNALTGQYLSDAVQQYREQRNAQEPLFQYRRCLVHFAVSTEQVAMTTRLAGAATFFLPFNRDLVNPPNPQGFATSYLWEDVWAPDAVLELAQQFVFEQTTTETVYNDAKGALEEQKTTRLLFPRYHQRRAVRRLLDAVTAQGAGGRYLIKHSAGSGKSNTIAWLAHRLANFYQHPTDGQPLFDSVIVVTDRRLLNKQLSDTVKGMEQARGVVFQVKNDTPSTELQAHIEGGTRLIMTTLQRFPVISATIAHTPGRRYAVLIDEAHSSQSGEASRHMKRALSLVEAETEEKDTPDTDDLVLAEIESSGPQPNVSFFAFTATPKNKTLELFGTLQDGQQVPFDEYTMRQAIAEGFILDVLGAYTSYKRYYKLTTRAATEDKEYETGPTVRLLSQFVDLQEHAIEAKARIMLDHFQGHTQKAIRGRARAMVVTRSRLHAVRYKRKFDELMQEMHLPYRALVAFSGTVTDAETGEDYTEASMNGLASKITIEEALKLPQYRLLIVANKFQTGFDEPLLHTMYVDKKLGNINTVQTLSRLNRTARYKDDTLVLDFVNDPAQVQADFQGYYDGSFMREEAQTDPNTLYDVQADVMRAGVVSEADLEQFATIYLGRADNMELLQPILNRCVGLFNHELDEEERQAFRGAAQDYVRLYRFLSQLITFRDVDLAKLYYLLSHLVKKLPPAGSKLPREVLNEVKLVAYQIKEQGKEQLSLVAEPAELTGLNRGGMGGGAEEKYDYLSAIIKTLNETFGLNLTEEHRVDFESVRTRVEGDTGLQAAFAAPNSRQNLQDKFEEVLDLVILDFYNSKFDLFDKLTEEKTNKELKRLWFKQLFAARMSGAGTQAGS
ncbi:type I restriction endonuclease subunit R [Hymenobacter metallicola]|uniref:Type I restriction endonuclease subunit R n=1 Tax=Hymenobacter metallicola TaxID=2563114 RepID=A0A4Z0PUC8_9BACT|nr:type I restriction endonuclease [Hymenobacter metallicola]TGE20886.1 type I restriction endonuclease subunit R [Hymenobacter metallicola]